jgi:hypothetical protein
MRLYLVIVAALFSISCEDKPLLSDQTKESEANFHEVEVKYGMIYRGLHVLHDDKRRVTCWLASDSSGNTISCLPDTAFMELPKE